ncbi:MAG: polysaccharide biosynthesis protein [Holosporaceae bacterium]|nr:polysaccharide biosynthesis protein [Holosporaceae bacterium]
MFNFLHKKIVEAVLWRKISQATKKYVEKLRNRLSGLQILENIPGEWVCHLRNVVVLLASYTIASLLIYPEFKACVYLKETFSLLCAYGAIFVWFVDRIRREIPLKVAVCVTACLAPVLFINSAPAVAIVCLLLIVICEFLMFEYWRGCYLFSNLTPVYIICDNVGDVEEVFSIAAEYKILELIVLADDEEGRENHRLSSMRTVEDIGKWLQKINYLPFYPSPKRLLYYSNERSSENFNKLLELSACHSIPLFKAFKNTVVKRNVDSILLGISPASLYEFDCVNISPQDKSSLTSSFKEKKIWICYDGRRSVLDLVQAVSLVNSADVTLLCESEKLMVEAERELQDKCAVKIFDIDLLHLQETRPDILFYNIPIKSFHFGEDHLKETVIKNVLDTNRLIQFAQSAHIPFVFVMSSSWASGAGNWIKATQRLGELYAQFADSQSRKLHTKFRVIRLPDVITDRLGILGRITSSISSFGMVSVDFPEAELANVYYRSDILTPLLKVISSSMKASSGSSCVYTIAPENKISLDSVIKKICDIMCLRCGKDVPVVYNPKSEEMDLEDFAGISEPIEKTAIEGVLITKFLPTRSSSYEYLWSIDEIKKMTTRELISAVFQSLSEKIKK